MKSYKDYLLLARKLTQRAFYHDTVNDLDSEMKFEAMHHAVEYKPDGEIRIVLESKKPDCNISVNIDIKLKKEELLALLAILQHKVELDFDEWKEASSK